MLNLKRPLGEEQIDEIAEEVVAVLHHLTMADIYLIIRRGMRGYYGELYESLSMAKVLSWFFDYFDERCKVASGRSLENHFQLKDYNDTKRENSEVKERKKYQKARALYEIEKNKK